MPTYLPVSGRSARRGQGAVLVMVACVLALMTVAAMGYSFQSRGALVLSARSAEEDNCDGFVQLALTEAMHLVRTRANKEGDPLFELVRHRPPGALWIEAVELPRTTAEMARFGRYSLRRGVSLEFPRAIPVAVEAEERVPYESLGIVRLGALVDGPGTAKAERLEEYGFRTVLTSPPRPFDSCTLLIGDPRPLLARGTWGTGPNDTMRMAVSRLREQRDRLRNLGVELDKVAARLGADGDRMAAIAAKARGLAGAGWPALDWKLLGSHQDTSRAPDRLHEFDDPIVLASVADEVDLAQLDLPALVGPRVARIGPRLEAMGQRSAALEGALGAGNAEQAEALADQVFELVRAEAEDLHGILGAYKTFQDMLQEIGGDGYARVMDRVRRLAAPEQEVRAHVRFVGPGAAAQATAFLAREPPPSGVVYVDDPEATLGVSIRDLTGRLVVVSRGDVVVRQASVRDSLEDLIVVVGYRGLEVVEATHAAIVSLGGGYRSAGRGWTGSLVLDTLHDASPLDLILKGVLRRQEAVLSGPEAEGEGSRPPPDPRSIHVAFDPVPPHRSIVQ